MESIRFQLFKLSWLVRHHLKQVSTVTWILLMVLLADLASPGYLKFNFLFARVDLSGVVDAYHRSEN